MRSEEERDQCIDVLMARVKTLEDEIVKLKGASLTEPVMPELQSKSFDSSETFFITESRPKETVNKSTDSSSLESAIGTRWIGRIGVLAILFGVAFFLKYSFDNKLIGETGRVILGLFWGAVFISTGEYFQKKKNLGLYGQMLSGGGLAILYLSLYAAFALYHLIPASLAAAGMLAVTTTGMTLSIRYSAYTLAAIALLGGFLTPVMLSTGQNQPLTLFGYILLLDIGTLLLTRFRQWPSLVAASLAGTTLLYCGWHQEFYSDSQQWLAFGIISVIFVFYNISVLISCLHSKKDNSLFDQIIIFGSAAFLFLAFYAQCHWVTAWPVKIFILGLAMVEIGLAVLVSRYAVQARQTVVAYAIISVVMTVVATFIVLEQRWILPALAAEMAALGYFGLSMDLPLLRRGAWFLGLFVLNRFIYDITLNLEPFQNFIPIINSRFLTCASAVTGFYILLYFIIRFRDNLADNEHYAPAAVFIITQGLSLILLSAEVHDFFRFRAPRHVLGWGDAHYGYQLSLSILWAMYASLLIGAGIFRRLRGVRLLGILLLAITILKVFLIDLSELRTFYRIISFVILGLLLLAVSYGYNRFKHLIFGEDEP
ncbi:MAG: DUF2339 domain-containing protein [Smithella sp.]